MYLTSDAQAHMFYVSDMAKIHINMEILNRIEDDLDLEEKLSILFLMVTDYESSFYEIFDLFNKARTLNAYVLTEFVNKYSHEWQNKLLEAICICNNRKVVKKLGVPFEHLETRYMLCNSLYSENLSFIAKCLYMLCESLGEEGASKLIEDVRKDTKVYESCLDGIDSLELHILYWIKIKYITVSLDKNCNLQNLLKHLKTFDDIEVVYVNLKLCEKESKKWEDNVNKTGNDAKMFAVEPITCIENQTKNMQDNTAQMQVRKVTKGLCIIVNQMFFTGEQYDTRYGTLADCMRLSKTFRGIGFNVHIVENLTGSSFLRNIETIPTEFGTDYDCLFLCILSHGCKGSIIASDETEISIEQIEQKICCKELRDVFKIVIIQACQGNATGQMNDQLLAKDGLYDNRVLDISAYKNFGIFMSTMQGCVSIRHKEQGSWFIQEFCNIIEKNDNNSSFFYIVTKVVQSVQRKRGVMGGTDSVAQLPELRMWRLETDFELPKYSQLDQ